MGNLGLTALTEASAGKKASLDANASILDLAMSDPHTGDMTSGNVSLTNQEFRENIFFLGSGVATSGRTFTIPNLEKPFLLFASASNTDSFDLIKGSTTISIAPGTFAWFASGAGANDLTKIGVDGAAAGVVRSPYEALEAGFDGPGNASDNGLWNASGFTEMDLPTVYRDDLGLAYTIATNGRIKIPAALGVRGLRFWHKALNQSPSYTYHGLLVEAYRAVLEAGGEAETAAFYKDLYTTFNRGRDDADHPQHRHLSGPMVECVDDQQFRFRCGTNNTPGYNVQPFNPSTQGNDRHILEVALREVENGKPEPLRCYRLGTPAANEILLRQPIVRPIRLQDAFAGSYARCGTNPSSATVFDINVISADGSITEKLGQVSFSTGGVATFSYVSDTSVTLTNPGFETGNLTGWTTNHGSGGSVVSGTAHSGTYAFRVVSPALAHGLSQSVSTPGGADDNLIDLGLRSALLKWWTRREASGNGFAGGILFEDSGARRLGSRHQSFDPLPILSTTTGSYREFSFSRKTPVATRTIIIILECLDGGLGAGYLDDVSLDLTTTDVILRHGQTLEIAAPAALNSIADVSITIAGRLV